MYNVLNTEFEVYSLNSEGIDKANTIAVLFDNLLNELRAEGVCLPGRSLEIVKTKLEEACFFAKKAMAINPCNQKIID